MTKEELDLCPFCKYNSDCFGANGIGPYALKQDELTYKEELEKQVIHLQNIEKALDEIIERYGKLWSDDYGSVVEEILEKYNLVNKEQNV